MCTASHFLLYAVSSWSSLSCFPPAALLLIIRRWRRQEEITYDVNTAEFILTSYNIWLLLLSAHTLSARRSMITCTLQAPVCVCSPLCRSSSGLRVWVLCRDRHPSPHAWHRWCQRSPQPQRRASGRSSLGLNFHQSTETKTDTSLFCSLATGVYILCFTCSRHTRNLKDRRCDLNIFLGGKKGSSQHCELRQRLHTCRLKQSVYKVLKMSAKEPSYPRQFDRKKGPNLTRTLGVCEWGHQDVAHLHLYCVN